MTSLLTAVSLLTHTLLGCCWHHEHRGAEGSAAPVALATSAGHGHDASPCGCDHAPGDHKHPHDSCDEARCVTLLRSSSGWDEMVPPAAVSMTVPDRQSVGAPAFPGLIAANFSVPLRTHLLYQVLLL